jgi:hypothetical protein
MLFWEARDIEHAPVDFYAIIRSLYRQHRGGQLALAPAKAELPEF